MKLWPRKERRSGPAPVTAKPSPATQPIERPLLVATPTGREILPLGQVPTLRLGAYAWATIGIVVVLAGLGYALAAVPVLVIPFMLALFPAAVLAPPAEWLKRKGLPDAAAALLSIVVFLGLLAGVIAALAPAVSAELEGLQESLTQGIEQLDTFLQQGPFGLPAISLAELIEQGRQQLGELVSGGGLGSQALSAAMVVAESVAGLVLGLVVLFFYLKDGRRLASGVRDTLPRRFRKDAEQIGRRTWFTIGAYIRGQLIIALVDAVLIGIGLAVLGVSLFLPLAVLTFFGGLFPIVGAFLAGFVAAVVALGTNGFTTALLVVALIVAVQQIEGNLLAPVVLGRATELHPVAVLASLTAGAVLLGVLGAFIAVPVAASFARAVSYLREERAPG